MTKRGKTQLGFLSQKSMGSHSNTKRDPITTYKLETASVSDKQKSQAETPTSTSQGLTRKKNVKKGWVMKNATPTPPEKDNAKASVALPVHNIQSTPTSQGETMSKEDWEMIRKQRMPRKPPASLGVYYEQDDECNNGVYSYPQIILGKGWDSLRKIKADPTPEQVESLQTGTDAPPLTSPPEGFTIQTTLSGQKSYVDAVRFPLEQKE